MKRSVGFGICVIFLTCFTTVALSETMYIKTIVKITLRTGPGIDHKIVSMIQSGQGVEVLEAGKEWSKIQTPGGQIGWVITNLLTSEMPTQPEGAAVLPDKALLKQQAETARENTALLSENDRLGEALSESNAALEEARAAFKALEEESGEYLKLKADHQKATAALKAQTEKAENAEVLIAEMQLQEDIWWFVAGAFVLVFGFVIGYSVKRQRRRSILM